MFSPYEQVNQDFSLDLENSSNNEQEKILTPFTIPPEFYYKDNSNKKNAVSWSYRPHGKPKPQRAFQGKPWWQKPVLSAELSTKLIIITDWNNLAFHTDNKPVINIISQLLSSNFHIVVLNEGTFQDIDSLSTLDLIAGTCCYIQYETPSVLLKKAAQFYQRDPETILLLDDYELKRLAQQTPLLWELNVHDLNFLSKQKKEQCVQDFIDNTERPKHLILTRLNRSSKLFNYIRQETVLAKETIDIDFILFDKLRDIQQIIQTKSITQQGITLDEPSLKNIKELLINHVYFDNLQILVDLIQLFPNLQHLQINQVIVETFPARGLRPVSQELFQLSISASAVPMQVILFLLHTFKITSCTLENCDFNPHAVSILPQLPQLTELTFRDCLLNTTNLACFANDTLSRLNLINNILTRDNTPSITFPALKKLLFKPASNTDNFPALFDWFTLSMPNLKKFHSSAVNLYAYLVMQYHGTNIDIFCNAVIHMHRSLPQLMQITFDSLHINLAEIDELENIFIESPITVELSHLPKLPKFSLTPIKQKKPAQITENKPPIEPCPLFNPQENLTFIANDKPFVFKPISNNKSQQMIIQKISQYLILTEENMELIPSIQDGICTKLCYWIESIGINEYMRRVSLLEAWNGKAHRLYPELKNILQELQSFLKKSFTNHYYFLGSTLDTFVEKRPKKVHFANFEHEVYVELLPDQSWAFLDTNDPAGVIIASQENLAATIRAHLGNLICINTPKNPAILPFVHDTNQFLREGGLWLFNQVRNSQDIHLDLATINKDDLSSGLRIRDKDGFPAWLKLLSNNIQSKLILELLYTLYCYDSTLCQADLQKSVDGLTPLQIRDFIKSLLALQSLDPPFIHTLCNLLQTSPLPHYYRKKLQQWENNKHYSPGLENWCTALLQRESPAPILIQVNNQQEVDALSVQLEKRAAFLQINAYVIHDADGLCCASPFLLKKGNWGIPKPGPGGPLHDFLIRNKHNKPLLIIHYSNFQSLEELTRSQTLLQKNPHADNTELPPGTTILGLCDKKIPAWKAAWFKYFATEDCPFSSNILHQNLKPLHISTAPEGLINPYYIELDSGLDWEEKLFGYWEFDVSGFRFVKGELVIALESGRPWVLCNPPSMEEFYTFFKQALARGYIDIEGTKLPFSPTTVFVQEGYPWERLLQNTLWQENINAHPTIYTLNPYTLEHFFKRQLGPKKLPGYLSLHKNNSLTVNLTRNLDIHAWGRLLRTCQDFHIRLQVYFASDVHFDEKMAIHMDLYYFSIQNIQPRQASIYISSDLDATVYQLSRMPDKNRVIMNISDTEADDLLPLLDVSFHQETCRFIFNEPKPLLSNLLKEGKIVILYGQFSNDLRDALTAFLLERNNSKSAPGFLYLIADQVIFPGFIHQEDNFPHIMKQQYIAEFPTLSPLLHEPFTILRAKANWLRHHPHDNPDNAWTGFYKRPVKQPLAPFTPENSKADADNFMKKRLGALKKAIATQAFVILTGDSGVGKTTTVLQYFTNKKYKLFLGPDKLEACLADKSGKKRVLFLDEANMLQGVGNPRHALARIEGLMHNPPGIRGKQDYYFLSDENITVIAGLNSMDFAGERVASCFLENHGNCLLFETFSLNYLYEYVLKPVFDNTRWADFSVPVSRLILKAYAHIYHQVPGNVALSARELQMMALLTYAFMQTNPFSVNRWSVKHMTKHFIYELAKHAVPLPCLEDFRKTWQRDNLCLLPPPVKEVDFLMTPSRMPVCLEINSWLDLQVLRVLENITGGLGGLIIQGGPKTGKFTLKALLENRGYNEIFLDKPLPANILRFCVIPPALLPYQKIEFFLFAFHAGAVTIAPKWNASCLIEPLMNALLMGKTPEGKEALSPGFMLIGLQYPVSTHKELQVASIALERRTSVLYLPDYPLEELRALLIYKGLPHAIAASLIAIYEETRQLAQSKEKPLPDLQLLLNLAEELLQLVVPVIHHKTKADYDIEPFNYKKTRISTFFQTYTCEYNPAQNGQIPALV